MYLVSLCIYSDNSYYSTRNLVKMQALLAMQKNQDKAFLGGSWYSFWKAL